MNRVERFVEKVWVEFPDGAMLCYRPEGEFLVANVGGHHVETGKPLKFRYDPERFDRSNTMSRGLYHYRYGGDRHEELM